MSETKYSPGPWVYHKPEDSNGYAYVDDEIALTKWRKPIGNIATCFGSGEANAKLIAVAPELLEMVKKMRATISFEHCTDGANEYQDLLDEADEIISKATGDSQ